MINQDKVLLITNSNPNSQAISEASADWYANARGLSHHRIAINFDDTYGQEIRFADQAEWEGWLQSTLMPVADYCESNLIEAVILAQGTPIKFEQPGSGTYPIQSLDSLFGHAMEVKHYHSTNGVWPDIYPLYFGAGSGHWAQESRNDPRWYLNTINVWGHLGYPKSWGYDSTLTLLQRCVNDALAAETLTQGDLKAKPIIFGLHDRTAKITAQRGINALQDLVDAGFTNVQYYRRNCGAYTAQAACDSLPLAGTTELASTYVNGVLSTLAGSPVDAYCHIEAAIANTRPAGTWGGLFNYQPGYFHMGSTSSGYPGFDTLELGGAAAMGTVNEPYDNSVQLPDMLADKLILGGLTCAEATILENETADLWLWKITTFGDPLYAPFKAFDLERANETLIRVGI